MTRSERRKERCHMDYSFNIYKVPGHSDCSRDGHMIQAGPKSFPKIHAETVRERSTFPLRLPACENESGASGGHFPRPCRANHVSKWTK